MSAANLFLSHFDQNGRYKSGDGEVGVIFLTKSGHQYPGTLRFKSGLLVSAEMNGAIPWSYPDESPLDGLKFLLQFPGEKQRAVSIEEGRIVHNFVAEDWASKERFLANFRAARSLFIHSQYTADPNGTPTFDTASISISDAATRGALWLTPKSVKGFDVTDFPELETDRQTELRNAVEAFKAVVSPIPADQPPTEEQLREAAKAFIAVLNILNPYFPLGAEDKKVEKALQTVTFPSWVVNWDYEYGDRYAEDDALWVITFAEGNGSRSDYGRFATQIIPEIRQALTSEGVKLWPHIRLRTAFEFKTA